MDRRKFIKGSFIGAISTSISGIPGIKNTKNNNHSGRFPVVAATWDNRKATQAAMDVLAGGGNALDAVEAGARVPEADANDTSVGYGGYPDREGQVTLDACIMDEKGNAGAVTYLKHIKHPVSVARKVMEETPHVMLSGEGALQFALDQGFVREDLLSGHAGEAWKKWIRENDYQPQNHDTIGILAIDDEGDMCGACSTSGLAFKIPGRVGDSPIIGAGLYVDNETGGACATGVGELVVKTVGSFLIVELMRQGHTPAAACRLAVERIVTKYPYVKKDDIQVAFVAMDKQGSVGGYSIREGFRIAVSEKEKTYLITPENYL